MSRRRERQWQEILARNVLGGGEEYYTDWEGVAREVGLDPEAYRSPALHIEGGWHGGELDLEALQEEARSMIYDPGDNVPPFIMLTFKCQRCARRLDTLRMTAEGWRRPTLEDGHYHLIKPKIASEFGVDLAGEGPLQYACPCGRSSIQFSRRRVGETLKRLAPPKPEFRMFNGDEHLVRPETQHETILG